MKTTLGEVLKKIQVDQLGTPDAEYKLDGKVRRIIGKDYRGVFYTSISESDITPHLDSILDREVEWPIEEEKIKRPYEERTLINQEGVVFKCLFNDVEVMKNHCKKFDLEEVEINGSGFLKT